MLLSREVSIPSRKSSQITFPPSLCFYWLPDPGAYRFKGDPAREPAKGRTHSCSATPKGSLISDP